MATNGERLATVQLRGHRAINEVYAALARQVPGLIPNLDSPAAILARLERLIASAEPQLAALIVATAQEAERQGDLAGQPDLTTLTTVGFTTLDSLTKNRPSVIRQMGRLVRRGINLDLTAWQTARTVQQYVFRRDPATGIIASWPGAANMASQHARMLMLTESGSANFRGVRRAAARDDGLLRYHVSHKHLEIDECDVLERQDVGFGRGIYSPFDAPSVPRHPRCRCYYEPAERVPFRARSEVA